MVLCLLSASAQAAIDFEPVASPVVDAFDLNTTKSKTITLVFKNVSGMKSSMNDLSISPNLLVSLNRCVGVSSGKTCAISVILNKSSLRGEPSPGKSNYFQVSGSNASPLALEVVATLAALNPEDMTPKFSFEPGEDIVLDFTGSPKSVFASLIVKNSSLTSGKPVMTIKQNPSPLLVVLDRCSSTLLKKDQTCTIMYSVRRNSANLENIISVSNGTQEQDEIKIISRDYTAPIYVSFWKEPATQVPAICLGEASFSFTKGCRDSRGVEVDVSLCLTEPTQPKPADIAVASPAGDRTIDLDPSIKGKKVQSCQANATEWVTTSLLCAENYHDDGSGESCILNQHTLSYTQPVNNLGTISGATPGLKDHGTQINLSFAKALNSHFNWTGACSGSGPCSIVMDSDKAVGVDVSCDTNYELLAGSCSLIKHQLTINQPTNGLGTIIGSSSGLKDHGSVINLSVTKVLNAKLLAWTDACLPAVNESCSLTMDAPKTVSATFSCETNFHQVGNTCVSDVRTCDPVLASSSHIKIGSEPWNTQTSAWSGSCQPLAANDCVDHYHISSNNLSCEIDTYTLTVNQPSIGMLSQSTQQVPYNSSVVTSYNYPLNSQGYAWTGDCSATNSLQNCTLVMTSNKTVGMNVSCSDESSLVGTSCQLPSLKFANTISNATNCVINASSKAYCWGNNASAQMGLGYSSGTTPVYYPIASANTGSLSSRLISDMSISSNSGLALDSSGAIFSWSSNSSSWSVLGKQATPSSDQSLPSSVYMSGALAGRMVTKISIATTTHSCVIAKSPLSQTDNSALYCWGANNFGQLGNGTLTASSPPILVSGFSDKVVTHVAAHTNATCALAYLRSDASKTLVPYCWGSRFFTMGQPTLPAAHYMTPTAVYTAGALSGKVITDMVATNNGFNVCVLAYTATDANKVTSPYCWGQNVNGMFTAGATGAANAPVAIPTTGAFLNKMVVKLSVSSTSMCALAYGVDDPLKRKQAYCWGTNAGGIIADGTTNTSVIPKLIPGFGDKFITDLTTSGGTAACAIAYSETDANKTSVPYCWGGNDSGQTGQLINTGNTNYPMPVVSGYIPLN